MLRVAALIGIIVLTSLAFWPITRMAEGSDTIAATQVLGLPVLGVATEQTCWLSIGLGYGVLFVGIAGGGVVAIGLGAGVGVLFGVGQLSVGMIAVGQLAIALVYALAQLGVAMTGQGQLIAGLLVQGQVGLGKDGAGFLSQLGKDLNHVLSFKGSAT